MPMVAIALVLMVVISAVFLVGILWALLVLIPFYAYVGLAVYLVWRGARKQTEVTAAMRRESLRQRSFNDQEMRAWRAVLEKDQHNETKRERALRRFDRSRDRR